MPYDVKLPDIGEGIAEGEIVRWLVRTGDSVKEDQPLVEVMTDKASVEIPSPRTGTIDALHADEGQMVPVGSVIISIALPGEVAGASAPGAARFAPAAASSDPATAVASPRMTSVAPPPPARNTGATTAGPIQATPAVRALAKELGIGLESIAGTGPGGRIVADDVRNASTQARGAAGPKASGAGASGGHLGGAGATGPRDLSGSSLAAPGQASGASRPAEPEERIAVRGLRRKIAEHMRRSVSTAASFTFVGECDMTAVAAHRDAHRAAAAAAGIRLTYLAYVFRALIEPLRQFPMLNATLDDAAHEIVLKRYYHLGLATHTDDGLTVPIVHHADRFTLFGVAGEIERLAKAAREHHLKLDELQGGTFTITSTGAHGGVLATPILHHPQVAILGLHEVKKKPAVVDGQIVARDMANFSLSMDHRVVDGAVGADFLYALIARLEHPADWLKPGDLR